MIMQVNKIKLFLVV